MDPLWGRVVPVPERNLRVLEGGETIAVAGRELDVEYTPGHASHHVVYFDRSDGTAYVGDVAGVRIPPSDFVRPPTPPPDIDVEAWQRSIDLVAARQPARAGAHALRRRGRPAAAPGADEAAPATSRPSWRGACWSEHGDTDEAVAGVRRRGRPPHARARVGDDGRGVFDVGLAGRAAVAGAARATGRKQAPSGAPRT